eukprot:6188131-Pleurochrysis_carterae.AAC.2
MSEIPQFLGFLNPGAYAFLLLFDLPSPQVFCTRMHPSHFLRACTGLPCHGAALCAARSF